MSASEDDLSPVEDDLEVVEERENTEPAENNEPDEANQNQEGEGEGEDKKEVKVKRVRNPQPKLNIERLKGPRGLQTLETVFKDVKFKGRGHEEEDLGVLMKNYEYWCHRLYPKFPFDDCLERMEKLGSKKPLQTYIKRIRLNMLLDDDVPQLQNDDVVDRDDEEEEDAPRSSFDDLLPPQTQIQPQTTNPGPSGFTDEQAERIRINRERAQRLRQQRLIRNKASYASLSSSSSQSSQINTDNDITVAVSQKSSLCNALKDIDFAENMSVDSERFSIQAASQDSVEGESFRFETTAVVQQTIASQESDEDPVVSQRNAKVRSVQYMSVDYGSQNSDKNIPKGSKTNNSQESVDSDATASLDFLADQETANKGSVEYMSVDYLSQNSGKNIRSETNDSQESVDSDATASLDFLGNQKTGQESISSTTNSQDLLENLAVSPKNAKQGSIEPMSVDYASQRSVDSTTSQKSSVSQINSNRGSVQPMSLDYGSQNTVRNSPMPMSVDASQESVKSTICSETTDSQKSVDSGSEATKNLGSYDSGESPELDDTTLESSEGTSVDSETDSETIA